MPTGYTSYIEDGEITTGKDFLMLCAKAFGACVSMREDLLSKPIPESFEEDSYYTNRLIEVEKDLDKWKNITIEDAAEEYKSQIEYENKNIKESIEKQLEQYKSYEKVLQEIKEWNPPTPDHENLKNFAIEQINMCASNDISYWNNKLKEEQMPIEQWITLRIECIEENIARCKQRIEEEKERIKSRNSWIKQLRESFI